MTRYRIVSPSKSPARPQDRSFLASFTDAVGTDPDAWGKAAEWRWTGVLADALIIEGRGEAERIADIVERWQQTHGYTKGRVLQLVPTTGGYPVKRPSWD